MIGVSFLSALAMKELPWQEVTGIGVCMVNNKKHQMHCHNSQLSLQLFLHI